MTDLTAALEYAQDGKDRFLNELIEFLRIPSISTLPEHGQDMVEGADWVRSQLVELGFAQVRTIPTAGHPVVYGEYITDQGAPTVLFYGHYDVQPADPLDLWESEPFQPAVRDQNLYARGASDMKGQVVAHLKAVESLLQTKGLRVNIKYLIEGEEEIGSPNLVEFLEGHKEILQCDFCLNADGSILAPDSPAITYALRGLAYFEVRLKGPSTDLHSGTFGGVVENPANVLARLIAGMKDDNLRVTLPGFYDHVRPLTDQEREDLASLPQDEGWWKDRTGAPALSGETGYTATERATARPTLDVNGLLSGFTGEGSKTVLPSQAMAKISMRLVPDQRPERVYQSLKEYMHENAPSSVNWEIIDLAGANPAMMDRDSNPVQTARRALQAVWGREPFFKREGGTVPVVGMIQDILGADSLVMGFGLPDDNLHAPNEKLHLPNFYNGIRAYIHFMDILGSD